MSLVYGRDFILSQLRAGYLDVLNDEGETILGAAPRSESFSSYPTLSVQESATTTATIRDSVQDELGSIHELSPHGSPDLTADPGIPSADMMSLASSLSAKSSHSRTSLSNPSSPNGTNDPEHGFYIGSSSGHSEDDDTETDTEFGANETTLPQLSITTSRSGGLASESIYELNIDDDSDFEEDFVLVAQQMKLSQGVAPLASATAGPRTNRKSSSSLRGVRAPHRQRSVVVERAGSFREPDELEENDRRERSQSEGAAGATFLPPPVPELGFAKRQLTESTPLASSQLSKLMQGSASGTDDPLDQYRSGAASSMNERKLNLRVYMPSSADPTTSWTVAVRDDVNVYLTIGYALYRYQEEGRQPPLEDLQRDANQWNLRLVEDDGEPDEDFPPLERTRAVKSYSVDELALVAATPAEAAENSKVTPNKVAPTRRSRNVSVSMPSVVNVRVFKFPFDSLLSSVYWENSQDADTTVKQILDTVCDLKSLDGPNYVLRAAGPGRILEATTRVGDIEPVSAVQAGSVDAVEQLEPVVLLELVPKRTLAEDTTRDNRSTRNVAAAAIRGGRGTAPGPSLVPPPGLALQSLGYYKYRVWRRQQVSFMGRHERELVFDGEYVHILPPSNRSLVDVPKMTSFHLRQIIKAKKSSKVPTYVKIFVMKQSGPKRYDLESINSAEGTEIVERINRLRLK